MSEVAETVVIDASVVVDLLAATEHAAAAVSRLRGTLLHAPAHLDAEVLSALGRLHRAGELGETEVRAALARLEVLPVTRHPLPDLLGAAWQQRAAVGLVDALYVALAQRLKATLLTTDLRLAKACPIAESVTG